MRLREIKKYKVGDRIYQQENALFSKNGMGDYREEAIDFCIEHKLPVTNTQNNTYNIAERYVKLFCPWCKHNMTYLGGSGNGDADTVYYQCPECKRRGTLTVTMGAINLGGR